MLGYESKETQITITLLWCLLAVILLGFSCNKIIDKDYTRSTIFLPCSGKLQALTIVIIVIIALYANWGVIETAWFTKDDRSAPLKERGIRIKNQDFSFLRGANYYLGESCSKDIFITDHNMHHFGLYILGGMLAPDVWWIWITVGCWWETLEGFSWVGCHDYLDFICNLSGLFLGIYIRNIIDKKFKKI